MTMIPETEFIVKKRKERADKGKKRTSFPQLPALPQGMAAMGAFVPIATPLEDTPSSAVNLIGPPLVTHEDIDFYRRQFGAEANKSKQGILNPENFITPDPTKNYRFCSNRMGSGTGHSYAKNNRKWGYTETLDADGKPINVMGMTLCERPLAAHIVREEMKTKLGLDQIAKSDAASIAAQEALRANLPASAVSVLENSRTVESSAPQPVTL